ncbi:hypothetical protein VTK56DRAFT_1992 [Thermocarpiscus australiensis]
MMSPSDFQRTRQAGQRGVGAAETVERPDAASPQRRNDESWVEVSSQPSSSSLSSIGDDIVTTGLRVGGNASLGRRRRRSQQQQPMPASFIVGHPATQAGATSSQEEYDETESEEDRVMTSSTEAIHPSASLLRQQTTVRAGVKADSDSDDDDENATALGRPTNSPVFRPQPNAFSHPPSHLSHRHSTGSAQPYHPSQSRPHMPNRPHTRSHRGSSNIMSPSYQADNDAALRASLTTLLSCAAAARGLPKHDERRSTGVLPSSQPVELRLVPESELMTESPPPPPPPARGAGGAAAGPSAAPAPSRTASNSSAPSAPCSSPGREQERERSATADKSKRAAAAQSRPARAAKKKRTGSTSSATAAALLDGETATFMSPTLLTWVVSAGVVVLVSVVGFGAGYVIGREVGRQEGAGALGSLGSSGASNGSVGCGGELVRPTPGGTLRRIRWGSVGKSVAA